MKLLCSRTLILVLQPDEERWDGAARMVADRLYDRVPVTDALLGQLVGHARCGWLGMQPGVQLSTSDVLKSHLIGVEAMRRSRSTLWIRSS